MKRRTFLVGGAAAAGAAYGFGVRAAGGGAQTAPFAAPAPLSVGDVKEGEDLFAWLTRVHGGYDVVEVPPAARRRQPLQGRRRGAGAGGGRRSVARQQPAAAREHHHRRAARAPDLPGRGRRLRRRTGRSGGPRAASSPGRSASSPASCSIAPRTRSRAIMPGLPSDVIACTVKLMSNDELIAVGRKVFNPLPGSKVGARGYMGARIQPNSPTDDPEDIVMQVFDGWSYAVRRRRARHQPGVERRRSGGGDRARAARRAARRSGSRTCCRTACSRTSTCRRRSSRSTRARPRCGSRASPASATPTRCSTSTSRRCGATRRRAPAAFGLYFETGQGADATNGHGKGFDMVIHESRKYGFARALQADGRAGARSGRRGRPAVGAPQRRRRLHRPGGVPHEGAARARAASRTP